MRAGFPHSEIHGSKLACQLPVAYRRLQRPSSPVVAKASTTCTYSLDPITLSTVWINDVLHASAARRRGHRERLVKHRGDKSPTLVLMQSLPRRIRLEIPDSLHFFRIFKEQPNKTYCEARLIALGAKFRKILVEPTGIEPVTSCLQSRRSPS